MIFTWRGDRAISRLLAFFSIARNERVSLERDEHQVDTRDEVAIG